MEIKKDILEKLKELKNSQCKKERVHSHALLLLNSGREIKEVAEIFDVTERWKSTKNMENYVEKVIKGYGIDYEINFG
ncbi:hypothetical protein [Sulfurimonas sp.]|jgi:hypothetical protein|uniref:hypothetical protein n=1 Tax=Sulfurimonas sp. TaxID=2022749 RepID=UPI0025CC6F1C|nr:hypothetical protein [Sulfurimonas sp.]MBT5935932.1 hypothetical protein [Sulfurimonas sp.]